MARNGLIRRWAWLAVMAGVGAGPAFGDLMIVGIDNKVTFEESGAKFVAPGNDVVSESPRDLIADGADGCVG